MHVINKLELVGVELFGLDDLVHVRNAEASPPLARLEELSNRGDGLELSIRSAGRDVATSASACAVFPASDVSGSRIRPALPTGLAGRFPPASKAFTVAGAGGTLRIDLRTRVVNSRARSRSLGGLLDFVRASAFRSVISRTSQSNIYGTVSVAIPWAARFSSS